MSGIADDCGGPARQVPADDGGPAFPLATGSVETIGDRGQKLVIVRELQRGLSLRDYFAAAAIGAVVAQKDAHDGREHASAAYMAYRIADAMLAERAKCKT